MKKERTKKIDACKNVEVDFRVESCFQQMGVVRRLIGNTDSPLPID